MAELSPLQRRTLNELEKASPDTKIHEIRWDKDFKSPKFISGILSAASGDSPETIARHFLTKVANLVILPADIEERLDLSSTTTGPKGFSHVTFQQVINGVPVFEGSIQVHINPNGQVVSYKAHGATQADISLTPSISADQVLERARQEFGEPESQKIPPESQVILFKDDAGRMYLAWHVQLFCDQDLATYHYFLDAHTGLLLYKYNDLRHVMARHTHTSDNQRFLPGQLIIQEGDTSHRDRVAWDAHANAGIVYNYFLTRFGRDSYDDQGSLLRSTVHYSSQFNNAFWTSALKQMVYGDGDGVRFSPLSGALDIVAHEFTHAVTSSTARFIYANEAGALDESFADFFGVMITNGDPITDWKMGEHVFTPGRPGDALRDVSDPTRSNQPDHTDNQRRLQPGQLPDQFNDNGFVHSNSGIPNKAAYLMVAGGTHHDITVQGLGKAVAEEIMYLALTVYLQSATPSRWTFRQARLATIDACEELYPGDTVKLDSVKNAWAAVGVGEPAEQDLPRSDALVRVEAAPRLAIPDAVPRGVTSVLTISRVGQISSVAVKVDIVHTYIGDLRVTLTAPNGGTIVLHAREGEEAHNIIKTYDSSTIPDLAALQGTPVAGDWLLSVSDHANMDVGVLKRWSLEIALEPINIIKRETASAVPIPDNDPSGISSTLNIPQTGKVHNITVWVDITHTWIGDLKMVLIDPSGETVTLHNRTGRSEQDLLKTYDIEALPALGNFKGQNVQGTWRLQITDLASQDIGTLNRWGMEITL